MAVPLDRDRARYRPFGQKEGTERLEQRDLIAALSLDSDIGQAHADRRRCRSGPIAIRCASDRRCQCLCRRSQRSVRSAHFRTVDVFDNLITRDVYEGANGSPAGGSPVHAVSHTYLPAEDVLARLQHTAVAVAPWTRRTTLAVFHSIAGGH